MSNLDTLVKQCLFCNREQRLKPGCQKQRWLVCDEHCVVTCPICGHMAFWMENTKNRKSHYACFSLSCIWTADRPPNEEEKVT